jgi:alanine racemase
MILTPTTWLEINKKSLEHNLAQYKSILGSSILAPVVKSNAYGHGIRETASIFQHNHHVDWLCTSTASEALILREHGFTKPILVLSCIDIDPQAVANHAIHFVVFDQETIEQLNTIGKTHKIIFNIHLKIDTGLSRLGIRPSDALAFIRFIQQKPFVSLQGICSHFAESQKEDQSYTLSQLAEFNKLLEQINTLNIYIPFKHISNSAGTTAFSLPEYNFFRVGIGTYGLWPSQANKMLTQQRYTTFTLKPVLTWKTRILCIKNLPMQCSIGYDRTAFSTHETKLAIIPVGYFDGFDRRLSNQAFVRLHNTYAPIIGRVSMNVATLNISHLPHAKLGDEVILLGDYPHINAYQLAERTGTDNVRELLTKISPHIPRIVVD